MRYVANPDSLQAAAESLNITEQVGPLWHSILTDAIEAYVLAEAERGGTVCGENVSHGSAYMPCGMQPDVHREHEFVPAVVLPLNEETP